MLDLCVDHHRILIEIPLLSRVRVAFAFNTPSFSPRNARGFLLLLTSVSLSFPSVMADLSDEKISEGTHLTIGLLSLLESK